VSISKEEIRILLDEPTAGRVDRFRIDFKPRHALFDLLKEEALIRAIRGAVWTFSTWTIESIAFLPVDGDPRGVQVTLSRQAPQFQTTGTFAVTPLLAAVAVIGSMTIFYAVHKVTRLGDRIVGSGPEAGARLAAGFSFLSLAILLGAGFFIFKAVT